MDFIFIFLFYTYLSIIWQNLTLIFWLLKASLAKLGVGGVGFFLRWEELWWPEFLHPQFSLKAQIISDGVEVVIFLYGIQSGFSHHAWFV